MNYVFGKLFDGFYGKFTLIDTYISLFWVFVFIAIFTLYLRVIDGRRVIARMLGASQEQA